MKKTILFGLLILSAAMTAQPLPRDGSYTVGRLKNGMTCYIRHNAKETALADFYIAQRVGSILEEPRQRGLAHFLEHMAFNGTLHFPQDSTREGIVAWCESVGVKFGANLNAYTSVDETVYHISAVPVSREGVIDSCLLILHDWSHYLLLEDDEIDKERGVIHEEWRTRQSGMAVRRMMERVAPIVYAGTKYADCLPIGSMDIVDHFPYNDLRDYYREWYRPDLQAVIVVGDIDVAAMEKKIKELFSPIPMPKNAPKREYFPVGDNEKLIVATDKDSEQPVMLATLYMKHDATADTLKAFEPYLRDGYTDALISDMITTRLHDLLQQREPPFLSASALTGEFFISRVKDAFILSFGCRQENIRGSFDAAVGEAERARRYGFTASEVGRAKAARLKRAEKQAAEGFNRRNGYYVNRAVRHFLDGEPLIDDSARLKLIERFDREVTLEEVNTAAARLISDSNQVLTVYAPDKEGFTLPDDDTLRAYVLNAQAAAYEPYREEAVTESLLDSLPEKGTIVTDIAGHEDSLFAKTKAYLNRYGVTSWLLSNGVRVYALPTDYDRDNISMRFWGEGGTNRFDAALQPNFSFLNTAIVKGGAGKFSESRLKKALAGKTVRVSPAVGDETAAINGSCSSKDLETMLQLTYLYAAKPRRDSVIFEGEMNRMRSFLTNREANPSVGYNDTIVSIVYGDSPRVLPMKRARLDSVSYDSILSMYRQLFKDACGYNMLLVGNIDTTALKPLLEQYVASLPSCRPADSATRARHAVKTYDYPDIIDENAVHLYRKKMNTPTAYVTVFFSCQEPYTPKSDLIMDVLRRVLTIAYTDSVREDKGGAYGVSVAYDLDDTGHPNTVLKISFKTGPEKYDALIPIIYKQLRNIADDGPEASSLDKVKKYLLKAHGQNRVSNSYWDYVVYNYLRHGADYETGYDSLVESLTSDDVRSYSDDLLKSGRRIEITMIAE